MKIYLKKICNFFFSFILQQINSYFEFSADLAWPNVHNYFSKTYLVVRFTISFLNWLFEIYFITFQILFLYIKTNLFTKFY